MESDLVNAFAACATDPAADEVRIAILVARALDADIVPAELSGRLDALAQSRDTGDTPWAHLQRHGFAGNREHYDDPDNSSLQRLLETRRGLPITLGVLLIQQARAAGCQAVGLNFPGHFLVRIDDELIDPFRLQPTTPAECLAGLPAELRQRPASALFAPAPPVAVGLRMLNNLKLRFAAQAVWHRALDMLDAQIALTPAQPGLYLERGEFWSRLGVVGPAREAYQAAVDTAADAAGPDAMQVARVAEARLRDLEGARDLLH